MMNILNHKARVGLPLITYSKIYFDESQTVGNFIRFHKNPFLAEYTEGSETVTIQLLISLLLLFRPGTD